MDSSSIVAIIIASLGIVAWAMIRHWARTWETRLTAHDDRLGNVDIQIATITANMEHILITGDETRKDVKELLRNANGARSTRGRQSP